MRATIDAEIACWIGPALREPDGRFARMRSATPKISLSFQRTVLLQFDQRPGMMAA
jgi:hypothetical protein